MNIAQAEIRDPQLEVGEWSIDIEVADRLVALIRPVGGASRYEIQAAVVVDDELVPSGDPFEASFGPDFDRAVHALSALSCTGRRS